MDNYKVNWPRVLFFVFTCLASFTCGVIVGLLVSGESLRLVFTVGAAFWFTIAALLILVHVGKTLWDEARRHDS